MSLAALDFKLSIARCSDGQPLPVLATPGGKQYVISEEGCEYKVVGTPGPRFPFSRNKDHVSRAFLYVDGQCVGYSKIFSDANPMVREGFCMSASTKGPSTYRRFKFTKADPSQDRGPQVTDPEHIKGGRISVKIVNSVAVGDNATIDVGTGGGGAAVGHLPEGKKFFLAPSLKTDQGVRAAANTNWITKIYQDVATLGTLELRYETASTLLLRKTLDSANPAHRQLLVGSRDPSGGAGASGSGARVKRERGAADAAAGAAAVRVKREAAGGSGGGGGGGFVDLTKPPDAPLVVGGRALARDEIAVCDLLDSDDDTGAARWEVRKRPAVEVEPTNT